FRFRCFDTFFFGTAMTPPWSIELDAPQLRPPLVAARLLAAALPFVQVGAAARAQPAAGLLAQRELRNRQQDVLTHRLPQIQEPLACRQRIRLLALRLRATEPGPEN